MMAAQTSVAAADSYDYCRRLTRRAARNFYYGLKLLPLPKRRAMFALYAYMRCVDDIADDEDGRPLPQRLAELAAWRQLTRAALAADGAASGSDPIWPAFADMARHHALGVELFDEMIAGQEQDLQPLRFDSFAPLRQYCYRVAGVVGLASIHIWSFTGGQETEQLALQRGIAFQLTNILRDLREDARTGRIYLPQSELAEAGVKPDDLISDGGNAENFRHMMEFQIDRARSFYDSSADLEARIAADSRPTLWAMTRIYRGILEKIAADPLSVLRRRISLSLFSKLRIGWQARSACRAR